MGSIHGSTKRNSLKLIASTSGYKYYRKLPSIYNYYHLFIIILQKDTSRPDKVGTHINTYSYLIYIYIRDQFWE